MESRIAASGLEPWLLKVTELRKWSDRWKDVELPLFPGYLFARGCLPQLSAVLKTPGVVTVVKAGASRPALLSDSFIASLRLAIKSPGTTVSPIDENLRYSADDGVIVSSGPLAGLRGVVQEVPSGRRLVVWIEHIGRGVAFTIGRALVSRG